jgi:hypothetical protein
VGARGTAFVAGAARGQLAARYCALHILAGWHTGPAGRRSWRVGAVSRCVDDRSKGPGYGGVQYDGAAYTYEEDGTDVSQPRADDEGRLDGSGTHSGASSVVCGRLDDLRHDAQAD